MKAKLILAIVSIAVFLRWGANAQTYDTNNVTVTTLAGFGINGYIDGQGQLTEFSNPLGIVADTAGNLYIWDSGNFRIRKITPSGTVSTLAGGGAQFEGSGSNVNFAAYGNIGTMAIDRENTIWIAASYFSATYFLNIQTNGNVQIQNGGITNLTINSGICFDSANNLYYSGGNRIWKYNIATGISQPFAGNGIAGQLDGNGTIFTEFSSPTSLAIDEADNIYVADANTTRLRKVDQAQNVYSITNILQGTPMAVDNNGNILLVTPNAITKLTAKTNVLYYAGTTTFSVGTYTNGPGNMARFLNPSYACFSQGSIFVTDSGNQRIRQISFNAPTNVVSGANLSISNFAGITVSGIVGRTYQIQSSPDMSTWSTRASLFLTSSPFLWIDQNPVAGNKFYRALLLP